MVKRKSAKELLGESIRELAESRPVDKITIQEIVDNCVTLQLRFTGTSETNTT